MIFKNDRRGLLLPKLIQSTFLVFFFAVCGKSFAMAILTGPFFIKATNAPLAGTLALTTDQSSRVSIEVLDGTNVWSRNFYDYNTNHLIPLLGFRPGRSNVISVTVEDKLHNPTTAAQPVVFQSPQLPSDFPKIVLLTNVPDKMEPGYTLFRILNLNNNKGYITIVDNFGEVVWYSGIPTTAEIRQLENGNLFIPLATGFVEVNMLGNTVRTWPAPAGYTVDIHEGFLTDHGTILYLNDISRVITNFPTSSSNPNAPLQNTAVMCNRVIEISATNAALLDEWSLVDMLQPTRITYLTFLAPTSLGKDNQHGNAIIEDPIDHSIIVSLRNQNAVVKFSRDGQLKWILGPHENWGPEWQPYLLTPVGEPFEWQYAQHAPNFTSYGTLMLFDDGNYRASPFDTMLPDASNYSRAVEYNINEQTMEVSQVWDFGRTNPDRLYTDRVGSADWLPRKENVLLTFGYILYENGVRPNLAAPNAIATRIREVTHEPNPEVVFDLACFDYATNNVAYRGAAGYRSHRIPDLYGHIAKAVHDLTIRQENGLPRLEFSADPVRAYTIEASTDLSDWSAIGEASEEQPGNFSFVDYEPGDSSTRFYRVATH